MYPYSATISTTEFWKLLGESRLLAPPQFQRLSLDFHRETVNGDRENVKTLAAWIVDRKALTAFQANVLLSGRAGPFLFGEYQVYDRIRRGRLSGFFRARHLKTQHPVLLRFAKGPTKQADVRWSQLASTLPLINDDHAVRCFEAVDLGKYRFLAVETLQGESISETLEKSGKLPVAEACRLIREAALGLDAIHRSGRAHGDVAPRNLWLARDGRLKLLLDTDVDLKPPNFTLPDRETVLLQRADYMAPEFTRAGQAPSPLTDIYALGCSLYECLAGEAPFPGGNLKDKLLRHATQPIQPLGRCGVPPNVERAVAYMMAKNPPVRYQTAAQVAEQLAPLAARTQSLPMEPPATAPAYEQWLAAKSAVVPPPENAADEPPPSAPPKSEQAPVEVAAVASPTRSARRRSKAELHRQARARRRRTLISWIVASSVALVFLVLGTLMLSRTGRTVASPDTSAPKKPPNVTTSPNPPRADPEPTTDVPVTTTSAPRIVQDDGKLLWASPTAGASIQPQYIPAGSDVLMILRPSDILAAEEGPRVLQAMGPDVDAVIAAWEEAGGVAWEDVAQLTVSLQAAAAEPTMVFVVQLRETLSDEDLLDRWAGATPHSEAESVYVRGEWSYFLPEDGAGRVFVMGIWPGGMEEIVARDGSPPLVRRQIAQVLNTIDDQRHCTLIVCPSSLLARGPSALGPLAAMRDGLAWLLGDGVNTAAVSLHFGDPFFVELLLAHDVVTPPEALAEQFRDRLAELPDRVESYMAELNPDPYWRRIAFRFPSMIRFLHGQTRVGVEGQIAVVNAVLPSVAAHNLAFGTEMLFASASSGSTRRTADSPTGPETLEQLLSSKISIRFDQDSLEFSMQNLANEVKSTYPDLPFDFRIRILGDDLKLDGITRNQQIRDFAQTDAPLADVLTALVMKANPVTTVVSPGEADQKLLWVVEADPESPTRQIILITTRQVADEKYTLPEVFRLE